MNNGPPPLVAGVLIVALLTIGALIATIILRGGVETNGPTLTSLITFLGLLVAAVGAAWQAGRATSTAERVEQKTDELQEQVNGHTKAPHGHSDAEVRAIVLAALEEHDRRQWERQQQT